MQDFVDIMMKRYPNKWGWLAGNAVQEAMIWGIIDSAMEAGYSYNEDRPYDFFAPLWGAAIGTGFAGLRFLPAAGKLSLIHI